LIEEEKDDAAEDKSESSPSPKPKPAVKSSPAASFGQFSSFGALNKKQKWNLKKNLDEQCRDAIKTGDMEGVKVSLWFQVFALSFNSVFFFVVAIARSKSKPQICRPNTKHAHSFGYFIQISWPSPKL